MHNYNHEENAHLLSYFKVDTSLGISLRTNLKSRWALVHYLK